MPQVTQDISMLHPHLHQPQCTALCGKDQTIQKIAGFWGSVTPFAEEVHFFLKKNFILTERIWRRERSRCYSCRYIPVNQIYVESWRLPVYIYFMWILFIAQVKYLNCAEPGNYVQNQHTCTYLLEIEFLKGIFDFCSFPRAILSISVIFI